MAYKHYGSIAVYAIDKLMYLRFKTLEEKEKPQWNCICGYVVLVLGVGVREFYYGHLQSTIVYEHVRPCMSTHDSVRPRTTVYDHVRQCTTTYDSVRPPTTVYDHARQCTTTHDSVRPRTTVNGHEWSCLTVHDHLRPYGKQSLENLSRNLIDNIPEVPGHGRVYPRLGCWINCLSFSLVVQ